MNYTLGFPYEDKSMAFQRGDVLSHVDNNYEKPESRENYKFVATGIDWGAHAHSLVTLGMRPDGQIDLMDLYQVPKSEGVEHIEEDLNLVVRHLNQFEPDIIMADLGYSGNYDQKLMAYYGVGRVYGVNVRSAKSNGDFNVHFNDNDETATLDKLTQNVIFMSNIKRGDIHFWKGSQTDPEVQRFITHGENVVIRTDEKENQETHMIEYNKVILRKGPDHYFQSGTYAMAGLDKLMKEFAQKNRNRVELDYLDSDLFSPEKTDMQKEYNIKSTQIDL